jgi:hypothetical protein
VAAVTPFMDRRMTQAHLARRFQGDIDRIVVLVAAIQIGGYSFEALDASNGWIGSRDRPFNPDPEHSAASLRGTGRCIDSDY